MFRPLPESCKQAALRGFRIARRPRPSRVGLQFPLAAALVWLLSACAPLPTSSLTPGAGQLIPLPSASASAATAAGTVFLIVMENKEYGQLVGSNDAPFINQLAAQYTVVDHAYAITHPSLPNYLALLGGDTFGITADCTTCFVQGPNLVDSLEARGRSWKAYMEDMPSPCFTGTSAGGYALKHNPFLYFQNIRNNPGRCERIVPLSQLDQDFASGSVPDFVWISPNLIHAMHDASI